MSQHAILCMQLKNEEENLERCLRAVEGLYEHHVIGIDTTSTDSTEAIVRRWMDGREGIIYPYVWRQDFSHARNTYLDLAFEHYPEAPWILVIDGDDVLDPRSRPFIEHWLATPEPGYSCLNAFVYLDADAWGIPYLAYPRATMLRNRPDMRFVNAAHNVIQCPIEEQLLVQSLIVWHRQQPKKRAMREAQRIAENLPNLQAQAAAVPDDPRALFYEANTLLDAQRYPEAEVLYRHYLTLSTWPDERYQVCLHVAAIRFTAGDLAGTKHYIWQALQQGVWNRAEAYFHLAECAMAEGDLAAALHWFGIAGEMPPPVSSMFLQGAIYTWMPHWRMALILDLLGQPAQAVQALAHAKRAYAWRPAPEIAAAIDALEQTVQEHGAANGDDAWMHLHALNHGVSLATTITPLPQSELERMLAEIPVGARAPTPRAMAMASEGMPWS